MLESLRLILEAFTFDDPPSLSVAICPHAAGLPPPHGTARPRAARGYVEEHCQSAPETNAHPHSACPRRCSGSIHDTSTRAEGEGEGEGSVD